MIIDRLIQACIPDIAAVYGGARGRTMSSKHQRYAWPALVEAGVKRVIDLRGMDQSDRLPKLCLEYGLDYYHYPIDNDRDTIASMVEHFTEFCELIDQGDFYIACAMGLHRTDTAIVAYWMFYAADKGMDAPQLHGYLKKRGLTTDKMMRIINAFHKMSIKINAPYAIPEDIFKRRKQLILQAWRDAL